MRITYAITACNEAEDLEFLLRFLKNTKRKNDQILIQLDNPTSAVLEVCNLFTNFNSTLNTLEIDQIENCIYYKYDLNGDFANFKNMLIELADGDYIFQIDADEKPCLDLILDLHEIIRTNPTSEVFAMARINTVEGITEEDILKWNWTINEHDYINYPDYQVRIWRNLPNIRFKQKVHEYLAGYKTISTLPAQYFLHHHKSIDRQRKQNNFYEQLSNQ